MTGGGVAGIILAGGDSLRYAGGAEPKALAPIDGVPLLLHVAAGLVRGGAGRIIVLTGLNHVPICCGLGLDPAPQNGEAVRLTLTIRWTTGSRAHVPLELRPSGDRAGTGGRLLAVSAAEIGAAALLTYTDIVTDAPVAGLLDLCAAGADLALLAVQPRLPWGTFQLGEADVVLGFEEKPQERLRWVNGGVMALTPAVLDRIADASDVFETDVMGRLLDHRSPAGCVRAMRHAGYWAALETRKDMIAADNEIAAGAAPWKGWDGLFVEPEPGFGDVLPRERAE